jgi:hypothetical protein
MTQIEIEQLFTEKFNKFTEPQQRVIKYLLAGAKLTTVNKHYASGGDYMWILHEGGNPCYAGSVYKAFWGVGHTIYKLTGKRVNMAVNFYVDTNFRVTN